MKRWMISIMLICIAVSFSALSETAYTFTDDTGKNIAISGKPVKTAVLFSSFADMWILSGGTVFITVGESVKRGISQEDVMLVDDGAGKSIDVETLALSGADFIIGSLDIPAHVKAREALEKLNVPFALFRVESISDYLRVFEIMTSINDNEKAYQTFGLEVYEEAQKTVQKAQSYKENNPQEILFIRSGSGYTSAKAKTSQMHFAAKMLEELGAENIADDVPVIIDGLSFEEIYLKDPDAIFISLMGDEEAAKKYMESLLSKKKWQALTAVKNGRCYFLSKEHFQFKPNREWAIAYEEMAKMLYPEWTDE